MSPEGQFCKSNISLNPNPARMFHLYPSVQVVDCKVLKCIYSSTVLKYTFEVLVHS